MMKYVGTEAFDGDGIDDMSFVVLFDDDAKGYLISDFDGVRPGGYLEMDGRYVMAKSDEQWSALFGGSWGDILDTFARVSVSLGEPFSIRSH